MENIKWGNIASLGVGSVGIVINKVWGGSDAMFLALIGFMTLDFLGGLICGFKKCELSSRKAYIGITQKKMMVLIMVAMSVIVDEIVGSGGATRSLTIFYYIGMEGLSLLETASSLGLPIPGGLKRALVQLNEEVSK